MTRLVGLLVAFAQPVPVYEAVDAPTEQTTILDVLLGASAVIGLLAAVAVVLGLLCAGLLLSIRRRRGDDLGEGGGSAVTRLGLGSSSSDPGPADPKGVQELPAAADQATLGGCSRES